MTSGCTPQYLIVGRCGCRGVHFEVYDQVKQWPRHHGETCYKKYIIYALQQTRHVHSHHSAWLRCMLCSRQVIHCQQSRPSRLAVYLLYVIASCLQCKMSYHAVTPFRPCPSCLEGDGKDLMLTLTLLALSRTPSIAASKLCAAG